MPIWGRTAMFRECVASGEETQKNSASMILRTTAPDVSPMVPPAQVWSTHYRGSSRIDRTLWRSRPPMIAHIWRGAVRREDGEAYAEYMQATGIAGYTRTPGNRAALMLRRDVGDRC